MCFYSSSSSALTLPTTVLCVLLLSLKFVYEIKITSSGQSIPLYSTELYYTPHIYTIRTKNSPLLRSISDTPHQWRHTIPLCCVKISFQELFCQHKLGLDTRQELLKFPSYKDLTFWELFGPSSTLQLYSSTYQDNASNSNYSLPSVSRGPRLYKPLCSSVAFFYLRPRIKR